MNRTSSLPLLTLVLLAACSGDETSASGPAPPGVDAGPGVTGIDTSTKMPPPQGTWTRSTNAAHYKVFESRDAAIDYFDEARKRSPAIAADAPVAASDARYAALDVAVADIWRGFEAQFPRDTEGVPAPRVLLVESSAPGAYAIYDDAIGLSPNVFMIQTPTLPLGDVALRGVIAHELAHHVLKHKWPQVSAKIERWYDPAKAKGNGFGFEQTNDAAVASTGVKYVAFATTTGDYPLAEWNGFSRPDAGIEYYRALVHDQAKAATAGPCNEAEAARDQLLQLVDPLRSRVTGTLTATPAQLTQIDALAKDYVAKETTCASAVPGKLFDVIAADSQTTEAAVRAQATPAEVSANDGATNAFDAIVRLTKTYDAFLLGVDPKTIRYYSYEEQADDVAASVLFAVSADPRGLATYLEQGALDAAGRAECASLRSAGEPPYGILSDPHHANCWRVWHAERLIAYLRAK